MKLRQLVEACTLEAIVASGKHYCPPSFEEISSLFDINCYHLSHDSYKEWDRRMVEFYLAPWYCTDQWVGMAAILLDGEVVALSMQTARKNDTNYEFISAEGRNKLREFVLTLVPNDEAEFELVNLDQEMGEGYQIGYASQMLTDKVLYNGELVEVDRSKNVRDYSPPVEEWSRITVRLNDGTEKRVSLDDVLIPYTLPAK